MSDASNSRAAAAEPEFDAGRRGVRRALSAWDRVKLARHPDRPHTLDYIDELTTDFVELHGDRAFGDDQRADRRAGHASAAGR